MNQALAQLSVMLHRHLLGEGSEIVGDYQFVN